MTVSSLPSQDLLSMSLIDAFSFAHYAWTYMNPVLPFPLSYLPLLCRVLAGLLAAPFALCLALDIIAYAIARTLHLSMSNLRVPRSPQPAPSILLPSPSDYGSELDVSSPIAASLESSSDPCLLTITQTPNMSNWASSAPFTTFLTKRWRVSIPITALCIAVIFQWWYASNIFGTASGGYLMASSFYGMKPLNESIPSVALVLTAHPDDEVMFFAPTILNLVAAGWMVVGVCLSDGDAVGLGSIRADELYKSYGVLGVPRDNVVLIQHPELLDGMENEWDPALIAGLIAPILRQRGVTHLITFDHQGITQHPNHISLSSVHNFLDRESPSGDVTSYLRPSLLLLKTPHLASKFTGPFGAIAAFLRKQAITPESATFFASPVQYVQALKAMTQHHSQLVWFRYLYVSFSHLMWVNRLTNIET